MSRLYKSPLRVYLCLGALAIAGIAAGFSLPISLYPNSSKPKIWVGVPYGNLSNDTFLQNYGKKLESQILGIKNNDASVENLKAFYSNDNVDYEVTFAWGDEPRTAQREVENVVNSFKSTLPEEMRRGTQVGWWSEGSGFMAITLYSPKRSVDEVFEILDPILTPRLDQVGDAAWAGLWNPSSKEVSIELVPETMASLQLFPKQVSEAVRAALEGYRGGVIQVGLDRIQVVMPQKVLKVDDLKRVAIQTPGGKTVHLSDIARVDVSPASQRQRIFRTSGAPSIFIWANPRPDGNIKRMAEDIKSIVESSRSSWPADIRYKYLVDPSEFIRSSIQNVVQEVAIGAVLAVSILFLFVGSFRNVATAAIEIPLSMVLAFILMKLAGMNLNLISLGGLALSAGMNVDASVVVMENIFRHFEKLSHSVRASLTYAQRFQIISKAVQEVRFPVITSTIASLVVFLPLAFTSDLTYAVLGDLAKAVLFSHAFSAFIALILVPTVRLQMMSLSSDRPNQAPAERQLRWLENLYASALTVFLNRSRMRWATLGGLALLLILLAFTLVPRLPTELIGKPDSDWLVVNLRTEGNSHLKEMEELVAQHEKFLEDDFGSFIRYSYSQVRNANRGFIMGRLNDKSQMNEFWKLLEARFKNTPEIQYSVSPWNPSSLPLPELNDLKVVIRGGTAASRVEMGKEIRNILSDEKIFPSISYEPGFNREETVKLIPSWEQWNLIRKEGYPIQLDDLADLTRVATEGRWVGEFPDKDRSIDIMIRFPKEFIQSTEDMGALPVGMKEKLVPLKALARLRTQERPPRNYRENQQELLVLTAKQSDRERVEGGVNTEYSNDPELAKTKILAYLSSQSTQANQDARETKPPAEASNFQAVSSEVTPTVSFEDGKADLTQALQQLGWAVLLSIGLIFITMVLQFGGLVPALLVLSAIPLGLIGVILSLWVFNSTLSLNSVLGVILLNGIAVANSIILVDFMLQKVREGVPFRQAAVEASRSRLRPILITSLTTILGMLPVALGMGDGGKILQPLGIAVSGGLWVSTLLTLFVVPALQVSYLEWSASRAPSFESWLPSPKLISLPGKVSGHMIGLSKGVLLKTGKKLTSSSLRKTKIKPPPDLPLS